jgi:hypothetical protein
MGTHNFIFGRCPACTREVSRLASRCPYCTTILNSPQQAEEAILTIDCQFCGYQIPSSAKICLHCNAQKVKVVDDSDIGSIISAIKYGFWGGLIGGGLFASWGYGTIGAIVSAIILGFIGYCTGLESEEWKR